MGCSGACQETGNVQHASVEAVREGKERGGSHPFLDASQGTALFVRLAVHQQVCRTRARAAAGPQACPKLQRPPFVANGISGWCAGDRTRGQISGHAEVSCLWSEAIKS